MRNYLILIIAVALTAVGCDGNTERILNQPTSVPATKMTRAMVGIWGVGHEERLEIKLVNDKVVIHTPEIEEFWIELTNGKIVGSSVHFVQKHFNRGEDFSPFNGVACNCTAKLLATGELEFSLTTDLAKGEPETFERITE